MTLPRSDRRAVLFCAFLLFPCVFSQRQNYTLKKWQENKFWFWASDAPMTKGLDEIPDVVHGVHMILDHFERVEKRIIATVGSRTPPTADASLRTCTSIDQVDWPRAVCSNFGARGFPEPDLSCITDFTGVRLSRDEKPPYTVDQLYDATLGRGLAIKANAKSIASRFIDTQTNYTSPDFIFNYSYDTTTATCVLHPVHGVRAGGRWRLATGIHNRPKEESLPLLGRKNAVEYHRVVDGHLTDNLLMRLPVFPTGDENRTIREDATTLFLNARGPAIASMYRNIPIAENPAIIDSIDMASIFIQQAEDAITPSNIAILVLPLALNIVPIALFAHVSSIQMLLYVLLSDILPIIPLLIKGGELIEIESRRHRAIVLRLSSSLNSTRAEAAAGEMWAAECQVREVIRDVGIIFVVLSCAFLVGGVALELVARSYLKARNRRRQKLVDSPEGSSISGKLADEAGLQADSRGDLAEFSASQVFLSRTYSGDIYQQGA